MLLAMVALGFAISQIIIDRNFFSRDRRLALGIAVAAFSGIPLLIQLIPLVGELVRAGRNSPKLFVHKLFMNIFGDNGPHSNLLLKKYSSVPYGQYGVAKGALRKVYYVGHTLAKIAGAFTFCDPFSGEFHLTYISEALWLDDEGDKWFGCIKPVDTVIPDQGIDRFKTIRSVNLRFTFVPIIPDPNNRHGPWMDGKYEIFATGSKWNALSKLYYETWGGTEASECSKGSASEFCRTLEALNDDSFVVKSPVGVGNDQTLHCLGLQEMIDSILHKSKKINCRRIHGGMYV